MKAGTPSARRFSPPDRTRHRAAGTRPRAAQPGRRRPGAISPDERSGCWRACRKSSPASPSTPTRRSPASSNSWSRRGQIDNTLDRRAFRQRRQRRRRRIRLGQRIPLFPWACRIRSRRTWPAIDDLGGPWAHNHYPSGWAQAGNTPLKFYKKYTFGGGVRAPLIMHWPGRLAGGGCRGQFHHAIDLAPTMLDLSGIEAPTTFRGVEQMPLHGILHALYFRQRDRSKPPAYPVFRDGRPARPLA